MLVYPIFTLLNTELLCEKLILQGGRKTLPERKKKLYG